MRSDRRIKENTSSMAWFSLVLAFVALGLGGFSLYMQMGPTAETFNILSASDQEQRQKLSDAIRVLDNRIRELEARQESQRALENVQVSEPELTP